MTKTARARRLISGYVLAILVGAISNPANAKIKHTPTVAVPLGKHVLVDGKFSPSEWSDALKIVASDSMTIYLKCDRSYFYVAVKPGAATIYTSIAAEENVSWTCMHQRSSANEKVSSVNGLSGNVT